MPPKKGPTTSAGKGRRASSWTTVKPPSEKDKNALTNMFKRIQSSDQTLVNCSQCQQPVKSCLMKDHLETKCEARFNSRLSDAQIKQELIEVKTQSSQIRKKRFTIITYKTTCIRIIYLLTVKIKRRAGSFRR